MHRSGDRKPPVDHNDHVTATPVPPVPDPPISADRTVRWRVDVVDYESGTPARFHLRWTDPAHQLDPQDWEGPTVPAAVAWAATRGLPDPEQAMLDAVTDTQR